MLNKIKSIVSVVLIVATLFIIGVPAMAAEPTSTMDYTVNQVAEETSARVTDPVKDFHYTGKLSAGQVVGSVRISKSCKTLRWTVGRTGYKTGNVRFKIVNANTGETRHFTTVADNQLSGITYVTAIPAGTWEVWVDWTSTSPLYDVDLYFYER